LDLTVADPATRAGVLEAAGGLAYWAGDMEGARRLYEEALTLVRAHGGDAEVANALYNASFAYGFGGDTDTALHYAEEAWAIYRRHGDEVGMAKSRWGWGASAHAGDRDEEARTAFEEALEIYLQLDDVFMLAWVHRMLGRVLVRLGEREAARHHLGEGLRLFDAAGDVSGIILHVRDYAQMALDEGDYERALTLVGALAALQERSGLDLVTAFSEHLEGLERASEELGSHRTEQLFSQGRRLSRPELIRYARG
jgi:tetratricopeptide (TPR) repeat protein